MTVVISNPQTPQERLLWAYRYGHTWNLAYPNLQNIDEGRVLQMNGSESDARDMIASFQQLDINVATLVAAFHGRLLQPDGDVGLATHDVMQMKRCAMPDYPPPPNAAFDFGDESLNDAVRSYQRAAAANLLGKGSWPNCDPQRPEVHSCRVNITTGGFSAHQRNLMPEFLKMVEITEAEVGFAVRHILDGSTSECEKDIRSKSIPGSVIGYCYFPRPDTCDQTIECWIDNSFNANKFVLAELLTHEYNGHGDGLEHTNGGIMNPSIASPTKQSTWIGDKHESTKRKYFGGVALPPPGGVVPVQRPELIGELTGVQNASGGISIRGTPSVVIKPSQPAGTFSFIAVPSSTSGKFKFEPKSET